MPVLAYDSRRLILDVFDKKVIIQNVNIYAISNNILIYNIDNCLYKLDLTLPELHEQVTYNICFYKFTTEIHELKLSENGKNVGVLLTNGEFYLFSNFTLTFSKKKINGFGVSDNLVGYETKNNFYLENINSAGMVDKSLNSFFKYFVFNSFCLVFTLKLKDGENNYCHKMIKISKKNITVVKTFDSIVDVNCKCSDDGNYVLVNLSTSYVKNSYFASTALYVYDVAQEKFEKMNKLSNILDFTFIKNGFCVVYGNQPSYVAIFNMDLSFREKFPSGIRNRIYFNRQESYVVLAGFEQLAGNVEVYDAKSKEKLSIANELGASKVLWDTTGSYYYVSTLNYLKEDNRINKYDYYGRLISSECFDSLCDVSVYGLNEEFIELSPPKEKFVETIEEAYVPAILKNKNLRKGVSQPIKAKQNENEDELINKLEIIEALKQKMGSNQKLETYELNLILNEGKIKKKLEDLKK